jgi:hypothetical protein
MSNQLQRAPQSTALATVDVFADVQAFAHAEHVATQLAHSTLIPQHFQKKPADCLLAVAMARSMGMSPLLVMQGMQPIKGKLGWNAAFLIGLAKAQGIHIRWDMKRLDPPAIRNILNLEVTAKATLPHDNEAVSVTITTQQAVDAGWTANEQYKHSCELMLRYRSATWLIRQYAPEILFGIRPTDELADIHATDDAEVEPGVTYQEERRPSAPRRASSQAQQPATTLQVLPDPTPTPAPPRAPVRCRRSPHPRRAGPSR